MNHNAMFFLSISYEKDYFYHLPLSLNFEPLPHLKMTSILFVLTK